MRPPHHWQPQPIGPGPLTHEALAVLQSQKFGTGTQTCELEDFPSGPVAGDPALPMQEAWDPIRELDPTCYN